MIETSNNPLRSSMTLSLWHRDASIEVSGMNLYTCLARHALLIDKWWITFRYVHMLFLLYLVSASNAGSARSILLLTDGGVNYGQDEQLTNLVKPTSWDKHMTHVFTLGIGSGVHRPLLDAVASKWVHFQLFASQTWIVCLWPGLLFKSTHNKAGHSKPILHWKLPLSTDVYRATLLLLHAHNLNDVMK